MKIEALISIALQNGVLDSGQKIELEDEEAKRLIAHGYAKRAETAIRKAPEKATKART